MASAAATAAATAPPSPRTPGGRGPRSDNCGGAVERGGGVAAWAVEEDEDSGVEVEGA